VFPRVGQYYAAYGGTGFNETMFDGIYGSLHQNAWTQERYDKHEKITSPALSTQANTNQQVSDYYLYDRSYLRLKNVEIVYSLPARVAKRISASNIRLILSGHNLITWSKLPTKDFGPEAGGISSSGSFTNAYNSVPLYRVYNVGLSVQW
jgi:hypothetical protein